MKTARINDMLNEPIQCFAVRDYDAESLKESASGGAFAVFARQTILQNGIVFGAALLEDGRVAHIHIDKLEELRQLQGSKYVQSILGDSFETCLNELKLGKRVLFSGTPCQVFKLRQYLRSKSCDDSKLICIDLICHGTPKKELFDLYLTWLSKRHNTDDGIHGFRFRDKYYGWGLYYYYYYYYRDGKLYEVRGFADDDPYYRAFLEGFIYRECCYKCIFSQKGRTGDITLGDYWGIKDSHPQFHSNRGVSAVLINTVKGIDFFMNFCVDDCIYIPSTFNQISAFNANLCRPTLKPIEYDELREDIQIAIENHDYSLLFDKLLFQKPSLKKRIRRLLPPSIVRAYISFKNRRQ